MSISSLSNISIIQPANSLRSTPTSLNKITPAITGTNSKALNNTGENSFNPLPPDQTSRNNTPGSLQLPPPAAKNNPENLFDKFDLNHDGVVTPAEIQEALKSSRDISDKSKVSPAAMLTELMNQNHASPLAITPASPEAAGADTTYQDLIPKQQRTSHIQEYLKQSNINSSSAPNKGLISGTI